MSPSSEIRLFIVLPVYGNWEDTMDCLKALDAQDTREFRVLIADDGSPAPPPTEIYDFAFAEYFRGSNLGFGGNCNRAAGLALDYRATHLLFLNSDTVFSTSFVSQWIAVVAEFPNVILSPLICLYSDPSKVWYSGGRFTIWSPFITRKNEYKQPTEVDIVCGCAMLVPAEPWVRLGGFDRAYETYFEDFDLCLRAKAIGIKTYVIPDRELRVLHKVSGSFRNEHVWKRQCLLVESGLKFIRIHYSGLRRLLCLGLAFTHMFVVFLMNLPQVPDRRGLWRSIQRGLGRGQLQPRQRSAADATH